MNPNFSNSLVNVFLQGFASRVGPATNPTAYSVVAEGRQGSSYAWCGDAVTHALLACGVCDPVVVNRTYTRKIWTPGANITSIQAAAAARAAIIADKAAARTTRGLIVVLKAPNGNHIGLTTGEAATSPELFSTIDGNSYGHVYNINRDRSIDNVIALIDPAALCAGSTLYGFGSPSDAAGAFSTSWWAYIGATKTEATPADGSSWNGSDATTDR